MRGADHGQIRRDPRPFGGGAKAAGGTRVAAVFGLLLLIFWTGPVLAQAADRSSLEVIDEAGRRVVVPTEVKRIVALGGALRLVTYLQAVDMVVGVEALETKPLEAGRLYGLAVADRVRDLPVIGEGGAGGKLPDFERVIAVHPDLIVAVGLDGGQVNTIQDKTGVPVVSVGSGAMGTLDLKRTRDSLTLLGRLLGRVERARELSVRIDSLERDLRARTAGRAERRTAYVGAIGYRGRHGITSTDARYAPLAWVNGHNVADAVEQSDRQSGHVFIDQEQLLLWNPDVIFLDGSGIGKVREDYARNPAFYGMLAAVRNGCVWLMPPHNLYHTNIETALANAYFLGKILDPEAFVDIEPAVKADAIFELFIGVKAYDRLRQEYGGYGRVSFGDDGVIVH